jgi:hypothetical protein
MTYDQLIMARERQTRYLIDNGYVAWGKSYWRKGDEIAMATDEVASYRYALDEGVPECDLMIRFRQLHSSEAPDPDDPHDPWDDTLRVLEIDMNRGDK